MARYKARASIICFASTTTQESQKHRTGQTCKTTNLLFLYFEMVDLFADGLQVALLGETSQQSLHTIVELVFAIKLERKREQRLKN